MPRGPWDRSGAPTGFRSRRSASAVLQAGLYGREMGERVEDVGDGHDATGDRNRGAGQPAGVAAAVPLLMMGQGDLLGHLDERRTGCPQSISAPIVVWAFIWSYSSPVSLPGLPRIASGIAILPRSCRGARQADPAPHLARRAGPGVATVTDRSPTRSRVPGRCRRRGTPRRPPSGRASRTAPPRALGPVLRASVMSSNWPKICADLVVLVADRGQRRARLDDPPAAVQVAPVEALRVGASAQERV